MANNLKQLDGFQVLKSVYSPATNCLRVCVVEGSTGGGGGFEVIITHTDDSIRLGNGTSFFTSTTVGPKIGLDTAIISSVLPDGASTEIKQDTQINELQDINIELDTIRSRADQINSDINSQADETQTKQDESKAELVDIKSNQTNKTQYTRITDGAHDLDIKSDGSVDTNVKGKKVDGTKEDLPVSSKSIINSTTTPLGAGATFPGAIENCESFSSVLITILTDQFSSLNGISLSFYADAAGTKLVRKLNSTMVPNIDGIHFSVPCEGSYFQIEYINGATPQTVFNLETLLKTDNVAFASFPLLTDVTDTTSAPLVRSVLTGKSTDGKYVNQRAGGISTANSTDIPLGASLAFTGTFEECIGYSNITVLLNADVDSSPNGFCIEWSTDGINVDDTDSFTIISGGRVFTFGVVAKYFRVKYQNGPVAQTSFRLQSVLHIARPKPSTHRIDDTISGENDAELVKAVVTGKNPNDEFVNKKLTGSISSQSTATLLTANSTFISPVVSCTDYIGVDITIRSDVESASEGLIIEFFDDPSGSILVRRIRFTYNQIGDGGHFHIPIQGNYLRISYMNGPTNQTQFVLATRLNDTSKISTIIPLAEPITDSLLALLTKSVIMGQNPDTGLFENAGVKEGRVQVESINVPRPLSERIQEYATLSGSREMNVDGGGTEQVFEILADAVDDLVIDFLTFQAFDSGFKIDKFLGQNNELTNGIQVEIKADDEVFVFRSIRNTTEFDSIFALGPGRAFSLIFASGNDSMVSTFGPASPFVLRKQGTFASNDYIRVKIRDNLSNINRLRFLASGRRSS